MRFFNKNVITPIPKKSNNSLFGKTTSSKWVTDYTPTNNTRIEIKFKRTSRVSAWTAAISANNTERFNILLNSNGNYIGYGYGPGQYANNTAYSFTPNTEYVINLSKDGLYVNNTFVETPTGSLSGQQTYSFAIGGPNGNGVGSNDNCLQGYIYYVKIWENNVLVRDYHPNSNLTFVCKLTGNVCQLTGTAEYNINYGANRIIVTDVEPPFTGLTLKSTGNSTVRFSNGSAGLQYKVNNGNWTAYNDNTNTIQLSNNDELKFKRDNHTVLTSAIGQFYMTGTIAASGNVMSLISDNYANMTSLNGWTNIFTGLFQGCSALTSAPTLPALTLSSKCYRNMFYNCTNLLTPPALPATNLADYCYDSMFYRCTSMTSAPTLPATEMWFKCYEYMFSNCTSILQAPSLSHITRMWDGCFMGMFEYCQGLTSAPALPTGQLYAYCYSNMFNHCSSLTTPAEMPQLQLYDGCYSGMYAHCSLLTSAPALPATSLASNCYNSMFQDCTSLTSAPELPADTLTTDCYAGMFVNCTALTASPELKAAKLLTRSYYRMFDGCSSLNKIICLVTEGFDATDALKQWTNSVSSSGEFTKAAGVIEWIWGADGIPTNWTVYEQ